MTFDDLNFEEYQFNIPGSTRAEVDFPNGYGVSVVTGRYWNIEDGKYDVMGLVQGVPCTTVLVGPEYTPDLPDYFLQNERNCSSDRVMQIIAEVMALQERDRD